MFQSIANKIYWGNTPIQWLQATGIITEVFIVAKILYRIFGNIIKKATSKSGYFLQGLALEVWNLHCLHKQSIQ